MIAEARTDSGNSAHHQTKLSSKSRIPHISSALSLASLEVIPTRQRGVLTLVHAAKAGRRR